MVRSLPVPVKIPFLRPCELCLQLTKFGCKTANTSQKEWKSTHHLDFQLLDALGVQAYIEWMANRISWGAFLRLNEPAYKGLTLEFLSTLEAQILEGPDTLQGCYWFPLAKGLPSPEKEDSPAVFAQKRNTNILIDLSVRRARVDFDFGSNKCYFWISIGQ